MNNQDKNIRKPFMCPWISRVYSSGMVGLHEEIEDFYSYMQPTVEEKSMRKHVVDSIVNVVTQLWPKAKVELFGSYCTNLYLPTSDIDVVIMGEWKFLPLYTLEEELIKHQVVSPGSTRVIDRAAVPIVKFQHQETGINVDICFNKINGINGVQVVKEYISKYPVIPKLMHILKHFLYIRDLNEVFSGGLGSYALFMLCVNFLQLHPRRDARRTSVNLGVLLIEFFELYGRCFNYDSAGIRIKNGGCYFDKHQFHQEMNIYSSSSLCIEDPVMIGNDLCKGSYAMEQIQLAFDYAYRSLTTTMCKEKYDSKKELTCRSYLNKIISVNPVDMRNRNNARENWIELHKPNNSTKLVNKSKNDKEKRKRNLDESSSTNGKNVSKKRKGND